MANFGTINSQDNIDLFDQVQVVPTLTGIQSDYEAVYALGHTNQYDGGGGFFVRISPTGYTTSDNDQLATRYGFDYVVGTALFQRQGDVATPQMFGARSITDGGTGSGDGQETRVQLWSDAACLPDLDVENDSTNPLIGNVERPLRFVTNDEFFIEDTVQMFNPRYPVQMNGAFVVSSSDRITGIQVTSNGGMEGTFAHSVPNPPINLYVRKQKDPTTFYPAWQSYTGIPSSMSGLDDAGRLAFIDELDCGIDVLGAFIGTRMDLRAENFMIGIRCKDDDSNPNSLPVAGARIAVSTRTPKVGLLCCTKRSSGNPFVNANYFDYLDNQSFSLETPVDSQYAIMLTAYSTGNINRPQQNFFTGGTSEAWSRRSSLDGSDSTCVVVDRGTSNYFDSYRNENYSTTAWQPSTSYNVNTVISNSGNLYLCTQLGTSAGSGGPSGTGSDIVDNTCRWDYLKTGTNTISMPFQMLEGSTSNRLEYFTPNAVGASPLTAGINEGYGNTFSTWSDNSGHADKVYSKPEVLSEFKANRCIWSGNDRIYLPSDWVGVQYLNDTFLSYSFADGTFAKGASLSADDEHNYIFDSNARQLIGVLCKVHRIDVGSILRYAADNDVRIRMRAYDSDFNIIDPTATQSNHFAGFAYSSSTMTYVAGPPAYLTTGSNTSSQSFTIRNHDIYYLFIGFSGDPAKEVGNIKIFTEGLDFEVINSNKESVLQKYPAAGYLEQGSAFSVSGEGTYVVGSSGWFGSAWQASTAYTLHQHVENDSGKIYRCVTAGTSDSSGGPTGTGAGITDNTVTWDYVGTTLNSTNKMEARYIEPLYADLSTGANGNYTVGYVDDDVNLVLVSVRVGVKVTSGTLSVQLQREEGETESPTTEDLLDATIDFTSSDASGTVKIGVIDTSKSILSSDRLIAVISGTASGHDEVEIKVLTNRNLET